MKTGEMAAPAFAMRRRTECPACAWPGSTCLYHESYESPALRGFVEGYYHLKLPEGLHGVDYELARCSRCQLAYQRMVPGEQALVELYDKWIPPDTREILRAANTLEHYRYYADEVVFLIQQLGLPPHSIHVLDYGLGWGEWARMASAFGCNVAGVELSKERIDYARSTGLSVVEGNELPSNRYHFVNAEQVFEHLVNPQEVLLRVKAALDQAGLIKISVPNARRALKRITQRGFAGLSAPDRVAVQPLEHLNSFEYASLAALGRQAGLKPLRPNLRLMYDSCSGWLGVKRGLRLLLRPLYRFLYPKTTFIYFAKDTA